MVDHHMTAHLQKERKEGKIFSLKSQTTTKNSISLVYKLCLPGNPSQLRSSIVLGTTWSQYFSSFNFNFFAQNQTLSNNDLTTYALSKYDFWSVDYH